METVQIMNKEKEIRVLGIESSCDETAAAVVVNGRDVRSNIISSQIALHTLYGGVVPEIASRKHIEKINQVIEEALKEAEMTLDDMDAIAVTYGPGHCLSVSLRQRPSATRETFRWSACIISRGISAPTISKIKNWSRRFYASWYPAVIRIW